MIVERRELRTVKTSAEVLCGRDGMVVGAKTLLLVEKERDGNLTWSSDIPYLKS